MDTNSMFSLLDIIVVGAGVYLLYGYYLLQFKGILKSGVVISKDKDPKKCKDLEGFKKYMGPRILIFGITAILSGGVGLYQTYVQPIPSTIYWIFYFLFLIVIFWVAYSSKQADKRFF